MRLRPLGLIVGAILLGSGAYVVSVWAPDVPVEALTARWAPTPSQFVRLNGQAFHLRDDGPRDDSLPVVLVHGTGASLHTWDGWTDSLRTTRRVIRFDLPGFGLTGPSPDGDYRMEAYVRAVIAVLDTLGVRRVVIGGNSLGGGVAWHVAVAHPERVSHLILVDAVGYPFEPESMPIGFRLARIPVLNVLIQRLLPRSVVEASVRNVMGDPARVTPALVDRYYDLTRREGNRAALVARFRQSGGDSDTAAIRTIRQPTLVLWGERDRLIPLRFAAQFGRDIPGSRVVTYPTLGHVPHEEDPVATFAAVRAFLMPVSGAAASSAVR
ncbi:MAG: alpha/beta hydrolase [Gemmatimonadetes bacterium]|nr:alpha/beta hydrolase [Gemmatimonadota bacterium]